MQECSFVGDLLCVDSLEIFRKIDQLPQPKSSDSAIDEFLNTDLKAIQNRNEKTPSKNGAKSAVISRASAEKPSAARRLFDSPATSSSSANTSVNVSTPKSQSSPRISYKLTEIYRRSYGRLPIDAHNADADTMHLLMCAIATQKEFVQLADSMATKFIDNK